MTRSRACCCLARCRVRPRARRTFSTAIRETASGRCSRPFWARKSPKHHIALWDTIAKCDIAGASDASVRNAEPNDIGRLLRESRIERIFATGAKSGELYRRLIEPQTHVPVTVLPSTSPANAAWTFERLVEAYRVIL